MSFSNSSSANTASSPSIENEHPSSTSKQPSRHRVSRACDACRKNKVKCPLNPSGSCQNCLKASRPCTFQNVGVRRERPPSKHEIQQLHARIQSLEKLLAVLAPNLDLKSLPRTPEQARGLVNQSRLQSNRNNSLHHNPQPNQLSDLSDPNDVINTIRMLNDLQISSSEHEQAPETGPSPPSHPSPLSPPQDSDQQQDQEPKPSYTRAVTQMWVEKFVPLHHLPHFQLPPRQLANTLLSLFFDKVNPFENLVHRVEFMRLYESDMINTDRSAQALCFALFAAGSTFSSDPSVMLPALDGTPNRQTAGATFLHASLSLVCPAHLPTCTLYDLQTMAVLSYLTCIICSPLTVWSWLGLHLRRLQNALAHRDSAPQWRTSLMKDQLRKRAVWYLAVQELTFSMILGRTSCIKSDTIDLELPLPLSDEALSRYCSDQQQQQQPAAATSPEAGLDIPAGDSVPMTPPMIFHRKFGVALQKLFAVRMSPNLRIGERDHGAIAALAREIDNFFTEYAVLMPWDPTMADPIGLIFIGKRTCTYNTFRILLHRLLIFEDPVELQICFQAANELVDVLDHLRTRGLLEYTAAWTPYVTVPATSLLLYVACNGCEGISAANRANAWVGVHRCISVLSTLRPISSLSGQLQKRLEQVIQACVTNELFSSCHQGSSTSAPQKREPTEELEGTSMAGARAPGATAGKRTSTQARRREPEEMGSGFPSGMPPGFFPSASSRAGAGADQQHPGLPHFHSPWAQFDNSLFHYPAAAAQAKSPASDPHLHPAAWIPPEPPFAGPPPGDFSYEYFDLSHSFIV